MNIAVRTFKHSDELGAMESTSGMSLCKLYSRGVLPIGFVRLENVCVLEATFSRNYYDGFFVRDSSPLRTAIEKVSPYCAKRMKADLHMTVRYPGIGRVPGVSNEDAEAFGQGGNFPPIQIYVRDIYVSPDRNLAAAVVFGIDVALPAMENESDINGSTPAHLTLWATGGWAPVAAGQKLIGLPLETRKTFTQTTQLCLRKFVKSQRNKIAENMSCISALRREVVAVQLRLSKLEALIARRVITVQANVRGWMTRNHLYRSSKMQRWTKSQLALVEEMVKHWLDRRKNARSYSFGEYDDYGYDDYGYDDYYF